MLNYIKAELYRNVNRKYIWIYSCMFALLAVMGNVLLKIYGRSDPLIMMISVTVELLSTAVFLVLPVIDMTTAEEHKNQTLKNVIASGTSRSTVIISKFVAAIILTLLWAVITLGAFYISGICIFGIGKGDMTPLILRILTAVPLYIAVISVGIFMAVIISNSTLFAFAYVGVFSITAKLVEFLGMHVSSQFKTLHDVLLTVQLGSFTGKFTSAVVNKALISSVVYIVLFLTLSIVCFKKKDIK